MDFSKVKTVYELANKFGENHQKKYESSDSILRQHGHGLAHSDPKDNEILVLYLNRTDIIKVESMWFDREGKRIERPDRLKSND